MLPSDRIASVALTSPGPPDGLDVLHRLPVPVWVFEGPQCQYANPAWYNLTGAEPGDAEGDGWRRFVHPADDRQQRTWRLMGPDGSWRWMEETERPWGHGRLGVLHDATAARRAEHLWTLAQAELRRAEDERRLFLKSASHELRTPISVALLQLEMAMRTQLPEPSRHHVEVALRNVERMQTLVADLVHVAHQQASVGNLEAEDVDLQVILQQAVASMAVAAQVKGIEVTSGGGSVPVWGDPNRLAQVAMNLLSNAIKFTPRGGRVDASCASEDGQAVFRVADSGPGIAADRRDRLFRPFSQVHDARLDTGSGLGLYLCKAIVDAHGGSISLEDTDQGACFKVQLPCL